MTPAHALIVEAVRAGVLLIADGPRLRFKALATMPPALAARIKAHRADVLALLRPAPILAPAPANGPEVQPNAADAPRAKSAGLLASVRDAFAPLVLDVVSRDSPAAYGGQSEADAERIALDELKAIVDNKHP